MRSTWTQIWRLMANLALVAVQLAGISPGLAAPDPAIPKDRLALVEQSGEIFTGTIDIVTEVSGRAINDDLPPYVTRYTVLVDEVLKGHLEPQSMVVVEQIGGSGQFAAGDTALSPGSRYLFFTRYLPGERVYAISEPGNGNQPVPDTDGLDAWRKIVAAAWCAYDDVLVMDGVVYQRRNWNDDKRYLEREWVGAAIAEVETQDTAANGCRIDQGDLTATSAPPGTKIQTLKGYATSFRVALRLPDRHRYLYEAIRNDKATTGADLLDIRGRVASIAAERWFECNDTPGAESLCDIDMHETDQEDDVATIVDLVLDAPVLQERVDLYDGIGKYLRIRFVLDDGSTVDVTGSLLTGMTANGIELPIDGIILMLWGG